jgi:hypothetical protein
MNGNGKGGNNRGRPFKRRERDTDSRGNQPRPSLGAGPHRPQDTASSGVPQKNRRRPPDAGLFGATIRGLDKKSPLFDRPTWTPPQLSTGSIPQPNCPYCGKPIKDLSAAIADRNTGEPVHFDCVAARIAEGETLDSGDVVTYIGGGRFGIVHFPGMIRDAVQGRNTGGANGDSYDTKNFQIKKIFEWEDKENRAPWRKDVGDHFSVV